LQLPLGKRAYLELLRCDSTCVADRCSRANQLNSLRILPGHSLPAFWSAVLLDKRLHGPSNRCASGNGKPTRDGCE
jgi:hypothetical protein